MRILFDECVPRKLRTLLPGFNCRTVPEMKWQGKRNGVLLAAANLEFDVLLTTDRGYEYQQDATGLRISVIILTASSNTIRCTIPTRASVAGVP